MNKTVDSYRFITGITKRMIQNWIKLEIPRPIPWTPLTKPLSDCNVTLLSSAGIALKTDQPFNQETERQQPWWGDPSYRRLPNTATEKDVRLYHLHIDPQYAEQDLNCLFPLQRLVEMEQSGRIGRSSPRHYSIMGYILNPEVLLRDTVPALIRDLREDFTDVVVLVPA
ncbi:MAG TPA: glycine/sarcosine/betaine reductase selenoprotein B family protein [Anaerolineaceae bacterium]